MKIEKILALDNIAEKLDKSKLEEISIKCYQGYVEDLGSRSGWEKQNKEGLELALQIMEVKNTPWENASNVKFPLITIAAIQFSSRATPTLVSGKDIVKVRTIGKDANGEKEKRAKRVSRHMSYQVMEEDVDWKDDHDKMLVSLPIVGCGFKKSYFSQARGHNISENVFPTDLVVDYFAKSLESADRITHVIPRSKNYVKERQRLDVYLDVDLSAPAYDAEDKLSDERQKITPGTNTPHTLLEQHCYLDLDDDGYEEPYIVLLDKTSKQVLRITARYNNNSIVSSPKYDVAKINPDHYFTQYNFMHSPDGGFYGLGFGSLLSPINDSINTIINQLIDAGTMSILSGGFIGKGARLKRGDTRFKPFEWKTVQSAGGDLRKSIVPLPVREPSQTLFQLLNLLIEYGERISGVTDMMVGKTPGQNTPATTSMAALEQGQQVFTSIHGRLYRAQTAEFRKLYRLNSIYLQPQTYFQILDEEEEVLQSDYSGDPTDIKPASDPTVLNNAQKISKAQSLKEAAMQNPSYNRNEVERRWLESMDFDDIDVLYPIGENAIKPQPDPKIEIESIKAQALLLTAQSDADFKEQKLEFEFFETDARIGVMEADAILKLAKAEAAEDGVQLDAYKTIISEMKEKREAMRQDYDRRKEGNNEQGGLPGLEGDPGNPASVPIPEGGPGENTGQPPGQPG